jgi:hypothetical protein
MALFGRKESPVDMLYQLAEDIEVGMFADRDIELEIELTRWGSDGGS